MHRYICCYNRLQQPQCKKEPLCLVLIATSGVQYRKNKCLTISSHIHQSNNKHCFAVIFLVSTRIAESQRWQQSILLQK